MDQHKEKVRKANEAVQKAKGQVELDHWRPQYHVAAPAYWVNDPNGFVFYQGEYHLFYQHHPYSAEWGPMHWGHVKSKDLARWEHLPIALAPSEDYDKDGCFSGSAIEKDGKLYLMYTGHRWTGENHDTDVKQVQCLAVSDDGIHFDKFENNPVISDVPAGNVQPNHIRDPKVWKSGAYYYCVLGSKTNQEKGQVLLYRSIDLINWQFLNVVAKGEGNCGHMWECPDLFQLGEKDILIMSPQGIKPEGDLYHNVHQAGYVIGDLNYDTGLLEHGKFELLDYGFDFYAPQTTFDDQGRRILIAWMAMWESEMPEQKYNWAGAMTLPRELTIVDDKIIQRPVAELETLRVAEVIHQNIAVKNETQLDGISGDILELEMTIDARQASSFGLKLRMNKETKEETVLTYNKSEAKLVLDRNRSGKGPAGTRRAPVSLKDNKLNLRIFVDKSSIEVFINGGEQVMTARIYPSEQATEINFFADEKIELTSLKKWSLKLA